MVDSDSRNTDLLVEVLKLTQKLEDALLEIQDAE